MGQLQEINVENWRQLVRATVDKKHAFRFATLGTIASDGPRIRMIVLREANFQQRCLTFYTHYLSPKVKQLSVEKAVSCLFWNDRHMVQLRMQGQAQVHYQDSISELHWGKVPEFRRFEYTNPVAPGFEIDAADEIRQHQGAAETTHYFAVIRVFIDQIDWLKLGRAGHKRASFQWTAEAWQGSWVLP